VLVAGGWFAVREKYCWLADDKPSEQGVAWKHKQTINPPLFFFLPLMIGVTFDLSAL
jgi:hypothetical protein